VKDCSDDAAQCELWAIPPDQAPVGVYRQPTPEPAPQPSPNQLDLFNEYMLRVLGRGDGPL